jgi:hypothetical protein
MMEIDLDPTVALTPEPAGILAPDAIQPEPTVMLAPDDAFAEPEATVAMLPDDLELEEAMPLEVEATASMEAKVEDTEATIPGWDATAGGITSAADPPWMAGVAASAAAPAPVPPPVPPPVPARAAAVAAPPPVPRHEPPPLPVAPRKPAASATPAPRPVERAPERPPAPKPRRETPPAAAASPPRRREVVRPPDEEAPVPPSRKGAPMGLLIGGGLLAAAAVAVAGWWMLTRGPAAPDEAAPPSTVAGLRPAARPSAPEAAEEPRPAVDAPVEEEVTIVPLPRAGATPSPVSSRAPVAPPPTQVAAAPPPVTAAPVAPPPAVVAAAIVSRAEAARSAGDLNAAAELFEQALRADPGNAAATSGQAAVTAARAAARKAFMPGRTVVQTQAAKSDLGGGFDTADVSVKKAPDFSGRIEFAVSPPRVKPGDSYAVQIFLVNEGKKAIKVSGVSVTTNLNGSKSGRSVASPVKEVPPSQRALLGELPGVWPEDVNWWSAEVMVTANKGDSLKNLLTWK